MRNIYDQQHRITYYDLDCQGKLKLSALLRLAHIAADINAKDLGCGFNVLSPLSMSFVLQRFGLAAARLPVYDEAVRLRTWPAAIAKGTFTRQGDMYDSAGVKLMEWTSLWVLLDLSARKILRPNALPVPMEVTDPQGVTVTAKKIEFPPNGGRQVASYRHTVLYSEVDTNMHMNNTYYGDMVSNALYSSGNPAAGKWAQIQINYLSETRLGDAVDVVCRQNGSSFWITGTTEEKTTFNATAVCTAD